jgi:hypothetical protein
MEIVFEKIAPRELAIHAHVFTVVSAVDHTVDSRGRKVLQLNTFFHIGNRTATTKIVPFFG